MLCKVPVHIISFSRKWLFFLFVAVLSGFSGFGQPLTIKGKNLSLEDVFREIQIQTGYTFCYMSEITEKAPTVDLDLRHASLLEVLETCLKGLAIGVRFNEKSITLFLTSPYEPNFNLYLPLKGQVRGADGEPLGCASLSIDGGQKVITREDGSFCLPVKARNTRVTISFAGYAPQTFLLSNTEFQAVSLQHTIMPMEAVSVEAYVKSTTRIPSVVPELVVSKSRIADGVNTNVLSALMGIVPGMNIRQHNGVPGSAYSVLIRGQHSIAQGNDPLIVIDGVPMAPNNSSSSRIGTGSAQGQLGASPLNAIPPSAIEKIEIIKGADASAIYGSQGANGVLLLTLKKAKPGRPQFAVDISSGSDRVVMTSPLLNTSQYLGLRKEALQNDGLPVNAVTMPEYYLWDNSRNTDFKKTVTGNIRLRHDARVELYGGGTNSYYLVSGDFTHLSAVFPGSTGDDRQSLYTNLHTQSKNRRLQLDGSLLFSLENNRLPIQDPSYAMYLAPEAPPFRDAAGSSIWSNYGISYLNIPALQYNSYHASVRNYLSRLQMEYRLFPNLLFRSSLGYNASHSREFSQEPIAGIAHSPTLFANQYRAAIVNTLTHFSETLEYIRSWGSGKLTAVAGVDWQYQKARSLSASGSPEITENSAYTGYRHRALFSRLNYNFGSRYIASLSGRKEVFGQFPPGNRSGYFWSVAGAWIFNNENFANRWNWLSQGKLWGNLGTTGNDQIVNSPFTLSHTPLFNSGPAWEVNYNSSLGLDLSFLQNKISFSAIAFKDWTLNQLIYNASPGQTGLSGSYTRVPATVVNKGFEFSLQTRNISNARFKWESAFTVTIPVNRLTRFPGLASSPYASTLVLGKSLSVIKGYHYEGVDPVSGLFRFQDLNKDGLLDQRDMFLGGNLDPHCYGELSQRLKYRNWQLGFSFEFRVQNGLNPYVVFYQNNPPGFTTASMLNNGPTEWLDHWRKPGDKATLQKLTSNTSSEAWQAILRYENSSARLIDASFVRWKGLSLSYQLPQKTISRWGMSEAMLYFKGQNLLTFTHFPVTDPETQDPMVLPPMRSVMMGMRVGF